MPAAANVTELMRGAPRRLLLGTRRHRTCLDWAAYRPSLRRPFMLLPSLCRPTAAKRSRPGRRGSLTVEMIMVVVVLAIVTVAIVQFGVFFANAQEVAL